MRTRLVTLMIATFLAVTLPGCTDEPKPERAPADAPACTGTKGYGWTETLQMGSGFAADLGAIRFFSERSASWPWQLDPAALQRVQVNATWDSTLDARLAIAVELGEARGNGLRSSGTSPLRIDEQVTPAERPGDLLLMVALEDEPPQANLENFDLDLEVSLTFACDAAAPPEASTSRDASKRPSPATA